MSREHEGSAPPAGPSAPSAAAPAPAAAAPAAPIAPQTLPSGRAVELAVGPGKEELLVRSPSGEVEVRISFGREGPVVTVRGGRLEIDTPETIALSCRSLDLRTREALRLRSDGDVAIGAQGDLRVKTQGDVRMNGAFIRLNCEENGANPPPPPVAGETPVQALERLLAHAKASEAAMAPHAAPAQGRPSMPEGPREGPEGRPPGPEGRAAAPGCCGHDPGARA